MIFDRPMTKAEKDIRYKDKMQKWKKENYICFSHQIPKEIVEDFRRACKENGDTQRKLLINFMIDYIEKNKK